MTTTLAHQLAEYACALRYEDLSPAVVHEVKRRVIDSFGCALGAWNEEPCAIARKVASDFSARHGSTIIGTNHKAPPDWTAFANGCAIRYFDYNDTYLIEGTGASERQYFRRAGDCGEYRSRWPGVDHGDCAGLRSAMPFLRCGEYSRAWLGPRDLRSVFNCAGMRAFDESRSQKNASCSEHRRCRGRGHASGARRRALALERRRFCDCRAPRRVTPRCLRVPG